MIHSCSFSPGIKFLSLQVVSECPSFFQLLYITFAHRIAQLCKDVLNFRTSMIISGVL